MYWQSAAKQDAERCGTERPGQTKNIPVTKAPGHEGPLKELNDSLPLTKATPKGLSTDRDSRFIRRCALHCAALSLLLASPGWPSWPLA